MICVLINTKSPVQKMCAVIVGEIDNIDRFDLKTTAIIEHDFRNECLFRTCSVANNLVTSLKFHSDLCEYAVLFLANLGTVPYSLIFTQRAMLLQAVLQEKTELFQNVLIEMRNRTV